MNFDNKTKTNMKGAVWKNKKKQTSNQPDYTGNCKINDVHYFISGWIDGEGENKRISFAFKEIKDEEPKDDSELFF